MGGLLYFFGLDDLCLSLKLLVRDFALGQLSYYARPIRQVFHQIYFSKKPSVGF
jgi:hypothetical protein